MVVIRSFRNMARRLERNMGVISTAKKCMIPMRMTLSIITSMPMMSEKPMNFPKMILGRVIGLESVRQKVRSSNSRLMSLLPRKSMIKRPLSSMNPNQKSGMISAGVSRAKVFRKKRTPINTIWRMIMRETERLRRISRKVLKAILNMRLLSED